MFCEECGKQIDPQAKFCTACGTPIKEDEPMPQAQAPSAQPETVNPATQQMFSKQGGVEFTTAQQPYGQPITNQGYSQNMQGRPYGARPSGGGKTAVIVISVIAAVLIVVAALFFLYIKLRTTTPPIDPPVTHAPASSTAPPTVQPDPPAAQETPADAPQEMTYAQAQQMAASYSTEERPNLGTFTWYEPYIGTGAVPDFFNGATPVTNHTLVEGGWKMLIVWDPNRITNSYCWDLCNAQIWNRGGDSVALNVNYYVFYEPDLGISSDSSNQPTAYFAGSWLYDSFHTTVGYSDIDITYFYEYEGRQYAVGSATSPDGTVGEVALVRP